MEWCSNHTTRWGKEENSEYINMQLGNEGHQNLLELFGKPTVFASVWCKDIKLH